MARMTDPWGAGISVLNLTGQVVAMRTYSFFRLAECCNNAQSLWFIGNEKSKLNEGGKTDKKTTGQRMRERTGVERQLENKEERERKETWRKEGEGGGRGGGGPGRQKQDEE